jgi:hypothetical protein
VETATGVAVTQWVQFVEDKMKHRLLGLLCRYMGHSWMVFQATFCQVRSGDVGGHIDQVCQRCGKVRTRHIEGRYTYREDKA